MPVRSPRANRPTSPYLVGSGTGAWTAPAYWVKHNGCRTEPVVQALEDKNTADRSHVVKLTYRGGREGAEVVHLRIDGGGHAWPGGPASAFGEFLLGTTNRDIDGGSVLWEFFQDKRRVADSPRVGWR